MKNMYCNQCGQALPPTSRFCNSCGAAVVANSNVNVAPQSYAPPPAAVHAPATAARRDDLAPNESVIFVLRPTLIFVMVRYIVAILILLATAALMGLMHSAKPDWFTGGVSFVIIFVVGIVAFAPPVYKHLLRRREVYTLTNHKLEMRYGLLSKTVRNIPLSKIQDVT
ncbi:MAG TPA: PH domain-containing protein, partial [Blastocatellia bacterium]